MSEENKASLGNWVKDIDEKVDKLCNAMTRVEAFMDNDHLKVAEHDLEIKKHREEIQAIKEELSFMRGQTKMLMVIGSVIGGLVLIGQLVVMIMKG
ncbi:hypothetical protein F4212_01405 [Candidatus Poribacteria bacterium]|nr:hypothetical protein [Candidatus Poribacteria bacterium]